LRQVLPFCGGDKNYQLFKGHEQSFVFIE
jgi:hypothetical protein